MIETKLKELGFNLLTLEQYQKASADGALNENEFYLVPEGEGPSITMDSEMSDTSENPVQNKIIKSYVDTSLSTHTTNQTIHVTAENKAAWDGKATTAYVDNAVKNVTVDTSNLVTLNTAQTITGAKTFSAPLKVNNTINATGTITGSKVYNAVWNDYAEWFEKEKVNEVFEPGDLCIWRESGVVKANKLNDKRVVGAVSDTYGHILGGEKLEDMEDNKDKFVPIGLKGRIKCKVIGPVEIGDLITTSNLEGIGIVDNNCPINSIVGKALENNYEVETKIVTILV